MAVTIRNLVLTVLSEYNYTSPGEFYRGMQTRGYKGTQEHLMERAAELEKEGILESKRRGMTQNIHYRLKEALRMPQSLEDPHPGRID